MKQYLSVVIVFVLCLLAIACAWGWRISQRDKKIDIDPSDLEKNLTPITINVYDENTNNAEVTFNEFIKEYYNYNSKYARTYADKIKKDSEAKVTDEDMNFNNSYSFGKWKVQNAEVEFVVINTLEFEEFAGKALNEIQLQYKWIQVEE